MTTMVIPLQPRLPKLLGASPGDTAWIVTVTLLVAAILTPIAGKLGDMYGKRRVLLILLGLVLVGSVFAALSDSLGPVLIGRALQGAGLAVIPLGISILRDLLSGPRLGSAMGVVTASVGLGSSLSQPLSAFLAEQIDWHAVFWVAAGLALLCAGVIVMVVPTTTRRSGGRFDVVGAVGLAGGLTLILLAISRGNEWGWVPTVAMLACGVGVLLLWGMWELHRPNPLVDMRVNARRPVLLTNVASIGMGFVLFGGNIVFPRLLQQPVENGGVGLSLFHAALVMMPSGFAAILTSFFAGRFEGRTGPKALLIAGAFCVIGSYIAASTLTPSALALGLINGGVAVGAGLAFAAMPALIGRSVPRSQTGAANGVNALMRSLGTSSSAAVLAAVLAASATTSGGVASPSTEGYHAAFATVILAAIAVVAVAAFIPRSRVVPDRDPPGPDGLV